MPNRGRRCAGRKSFYLFDSKEVEMYQKSKSMEGRLSMLSGNQSQGVRTPGKVEVHRNFVTDGRWQMRGKLLKKVELPQVCAQRLAARSRKGDASSNSDRHSIYLDMIFVVSEARLKIEAAVLRTSHPKTVDCVLDESQDASREARFISYSAFCHLANRVNRSKWDGLVGAVGIETPQRVEDTQVVDSRFGKNHKTRDSARPGYTAGTPMSSNLTNPSTYLPKRIATSSSWETVPRATA